MRAGERLEILPRKHWVCPLCLLIYIEITQGLRTNSNSLLMKRRREHGECESREGGRGCIVLGTPVCTSTKRRDPTLLTMRKWMRKLTALDIAVSCLILVAAVAFRMRAIGIAPDLGVCLAPTVAGQISLKKLNRL
jgi:hypothetical protein